MNTRKLDIGEETGDCAGWTDEELSEALAGVETSALNASFRAEYDRYLSQWAGQIKRMFEGRNVTKSLPDGRISRDDFGFVSPPEGEDVPDFAQCETCHKWTGSTCLEFGAEYPVVAIGACDLYSYGEPIGPGGLGEEWGGTTPEDVGYVERPVRCENCDRFLPESDECHLYKELNEMEPKRYALDVVIPSPQSCCNAQTPKTKTVKKGWEDQPRADPGSSEGGQWISGGSAGGAGKSPPGGDNKGKGGGSTGGAGKSPPEGDNKGKGGRSLKPLPKVLPKMLVQLAREDDVAGLLAMSDKAEEEGEQELSAWARIRAAMGGKGKRKEKFGVQWEAEPRVFVTARLMGGKPHLLVEMPKRGEPHVWQEDQWHRVEFDSRGAESLHPVSRETIEEMQRFALLAGNRATKILRKNAEMRPLLAELEGEDLIALHQQGERAERAAKRAQEIREKLAQLERLYDS